MGTATQPQKRKQAETKRPLGVRVTPEQHQVLTEAAKREHRSVNSFVVQAALRAAESAALAPARKTAEQIKAILQAAGDEVRAVAPPGRDLLEEFLTERRREATREQGGS